MRCSVALNGLRVLLEARRESFRVFLQRAAARSARNAAASASSGSGPTSIDVHQMISK
jgi:hypothetical protein